MAQDRNDYGKDYVARFFGGPPLAVIGRLILVSILVGVILAALGLDPWNIIASVRQLLLHIWDMGFDALRWLWQYFLLGAVIVLPIWLVVRLIRASRGSKRPQSSAGRGPDGNGPSPSPPGIA